MTHDSHVFLNLIARRAELDEWFMRESAKVRAEYRKKIEEWREHGERAFAISEGKHEA